MKPIGFGDSVEYAGSGFRCRGESKSGQLWRAKAERLLGKEEVYFMPYL